MSDVWKSQGRYFCEICKAWMADNRASREIHEGGNKHKEAVQRKIKEQMEKSKQKEKDLAAANSALAAMEKAALESMRKHGDDIEQGPKLPAFGMRVFDPKKFKDVRSMADEMARRKREDQAIQKKAEENKKIVETAKVKSELFVRESGEAASSYVSGGDDRVWVQAVSDNGGFYYWHMYTAETTWNQPSSFYTPAEYQSKLIELERRNAERLGVKREADTGAQSAPPNRKARKQGVTWAVVEENTPKVEPMEAVQVPQSLPETLPVPAQIVDQEPSSAQSLDIPMPDEIPLPGEIPVPEVKKETSDGVPSSEGNATGNATTLETTEAAAEVKVEEEAEPEEEETVVKPSALGSWVKVKKEEAASTFVSPLTARYREEEEKDRMELEARRVRKPAEPKIVFEEKTAPVLTKKKTGPVEFKKKSGPKNVRKRAEAEV